MKAVFFTTGTQDTEKLIHSFVCLGHDTVVVQYDVPGADIVRILEESRPDVAIYVGAIRECHNQWVPDTDVLCQANHITPMIHLCSDAGDPGWWPRLEEYHAAGAFRLQFSIDGCYDSPMSRFGRVELTPVDPDYFADVDWNSRVYACGFSGIVRNRGDVLGYLGGEGLLERTEENIRYEHMCAFYTLCKSVVNDSRTGSSQAHHVKGRFIEAAMAGAVPLEFYDSPARDWYRPGVDYLTWRSPADAAHVIREVIGRDYVRLMARRLCHRVRSTFAPRPFWGRVLAAAGA